MDTPLLVADGLGKTYGQGETATVALADASFSVEPGEFVVLLGPSGSGKTTLLNQAGALERPTSGSLTVQGVELAAMSDAEQTAYRRDTVGFVFQFYNLVPTLTALENVALIAEITGPDAEPRAREQLAEVGLAERADAFPGQLSGGQQQRVAIARALVKDPPLLLCDEPTGALDIETGQRILEVLRTTVEHGRRTVLLVTHNSTIAQMADRVIRLRDGRVVGDERNPSPVAPADLRW